MPLLVGLLDTATHRAPATTHGISLARRDDIEEGQDDHADIEELAKMRNQGGGLLDSIANMANSILGAGMWIAMSDSRCFNNIIRHYWYIILS